MIASLSRRQAIALAAGALTPALKIAGASTLPASVLYYGTEKPLPRQISLQAGPVHAIFEPELAQLRSIRFGEREVLRAIYAAVRDRNWGTVAPRLSGLKIETSQAGFRLLFDVECKDGLIDFTWSGAVTGDSDGTIVFNMNGSARSAFARNRIGFCVLHPIEGCAGEAAMVETTGGQRTAGRFPLDIAPHQPFLDLRAIRHTVAEGTEAEVRFSGDVFEMEDQRNWTDASFKTYCTPLARPFPVEVRPGDKVQQSVTLKVATKVTPVSAPRVDPVELLLQVDASQSYTLPRLGLGCAAGAPPLTATAKSRLRALGLSHLRADLHLSEPHSKDLLQRATQDALSIGAALELAIILGKSPEAELLQLQEWLRTGKPKVLHYLVFHQDEKSTGERTLGLTRKAIASIDPNARLASGTNAYFTELNRERPPLQVSDLVCYSINPQVHAFDNLSLVETLEVQAATLRSASKFCGKLPLAVTPVTFKPRSNPNATQAAAGNGATMNALPEQVDVRQMSLFGAGWTLGSIKYLAEGGAAFATYFETTGWRGVMESGAGSALPDQFRSRPGQVFPLYHVLADVQEFAGGETLHCRSANPLEVEALVLRKNGKTTALIANLSPRTRVVRLQGLAFGSAVRVRNLDENSVTFATDNPEIYRTRPAPLRETPGNEIQLALLPYAMARIDSAGTRD